MEQRDVTSEGESRVSNPGIALDPSISNAWRDHFKKKETVNAAVVDLLLPSTLPVKAVRMPVQFLWKHGMIPDPLTTIIKDHIELLENPSPGEAMMGQFVDAEPEMALKAMTDWLSVLHTVWTLCVVQPSFTDDEARVGEGGSEPYYVGSVDYSDLLYVYQWAQGVDQSVADFLHQQTTLVERLSDGESLADATKHILRTELAGAGMASTHRGSRDLAVGSNGRTVAKRKSRKTPAKQTPEADNDGRAEVHAGTDHADDPRPAPRKRKAVGGPTTIPTGVAVTGKRA